ncbi:MAG TPA: 5-formyltetrahydrofolate cyclo-ligase [Candidatus Binatia bacterium]|jgi:5-formyltetrahydrofolate cyclo-ligase|nr:5-formyltetrahydrofolate cyclo-ligase [Candidatus Binatia bacterium]
MENRRSALRRQALSRRASLSPDCCLEWSQLVQARALELPEYLGAESVVLYWPVQNEVDTLRIRDQAFREGKKLFYPKLDVPGGPAFARVLSVADFRPGRLGIAEPTGELLTEPAEHGRLIVFVPGLLFDREGHRLGRGGGWYDRALQKLAGRSVFVGLAYDFQIVEGLPAASWDRKVHRIVTQSQVIDCGKGRSV